MKPTHARRAAHPLFVAQLHGTQREMGAQHGAMTRAAGEWQAVMGYYPRMPEILLGGNAPLARAAVRPIVEIGVNRLELGRDPELRDRTRAFLAALGLSPRKSRHYQAMDVFQNIVNMAGRLRLGPFAERLAEQAPAACSTLVAWGEASADGALKHARNFDFPGVGIWERGPAVVFCTPREGLRYGFVTVRGADVPAVSVFNEAGISITPHTRFHEGATWSGVCVVDLVHDVIRKARTLADAERLIRERPIASSWGLCVSSADEGRAASFEVCGAQVRAVLPGAGEHFLAVTNRYVDAEMQRGEVTISPAFVRNSDGRYALLRAAGLRGGLTTAALQALLGSNEDFEVPGLERSVGGVPAQALSVHSVVIEPEISAVHVSVGPAPTGKGPWVAVPWAWGDAPGFRIDRLDDSATLTVHDEGHFDRGAQAQGLTAFIEATAISSRGGDPRQAVALLEDAVRHDPLDPTYRLLIGGAHLNRGDWRGALGHFRAGLDHERSSFYRGQLLLWASRAAAAAADQHAAALRQELLALTHPQLATHHAAARAEASAPLTGAHIKKVRLNYHLADLAV